MFLYVEIGDVWISGSVYPYAKFEFNVSLLRRFAIARAFFHRTLNDILPTGGFRELVEDGFVLRAEFAADFTGAIMDEIDAFKDGIESSKVFSGHDGRRETMYLKTQLKAAPSFTIYDKKRQCAARTCFRLRREKLRLEAKVAFNQHPRRRHQKLPDLWTIPNPFSGLLILARSDLETVFAAERHQSFLAKARSGGIQSAFAGTRGSDRERRIRMLRHAAVPWWDPEQTWLAFRPAIEAAINL